MQNWDSAYNSQGGKYFNSVALNLLNLRNPKSVDRRICVIRVIPCPNRKSYIVHCKLYILHPFAFICDLLFAFICGRSILISLLSFALTPVYSKKALYKIARMKIVVFSNVVRSYICQTRCVKPAARLLSKN